MFAALRQALDFSTSLSEKIQFSLIYSNLKGQTLFFFFKTKNPTVFSVFLMPSKAASLSPSLNSSFTSSGPCVHAATWFPVFKLPPRSPLRFPPHPDLSREKIFPYFPGFRHSLIHRFRREWGQLKKIKIKKRGKRKREKKRGRGGCSVVGFDCRSLH